MSPMPNQPHSMDAPIASVCHTVHPWRRATDAHCWTWANMKVYRLVLTSFCAALITGCATRSEDLTAGESGVCELHGAQMSKIVVPIEYGLIRPNQTSLARLTASTNSFPHAETRVGGGCVVRPGSPHRAVIFACAQCKKARTRWEQAHDR